MHSRVKQVHDLLMEIREDDTIPLQDALIMIGLLKLGQTMLMTKCTGKGTLFPPEEKKQ